MVKIVDIKVVQHDAAKEPLVTLILEGDLVMVQSSTTGRFHATAKQCSITCTFSEEGAKALIGRQIPGQITKVPCEPYEYTIKETGEVISLSHRWEYRPETAPAPLRMVINNMAA